MAEVKYRITSKDQSRRGTESAKRNLNDLGEATKKVGRIMKTALMAVGFAALGKEIADTVKLFGEQEKVELRLAAAAKNNPYINGQAVKSLKNAAAALQEISIFGDEAIIQQQSFLTTLGLTETQINDVMSAAVDLASTGMVSLESAVRNIAKTYGGMTGELGELIPNLKELTAEELKAGEAVEYIAKQYDGMAEAAASGVSGTIEQFKNMVGDVKETIGAALAPIAKNILTAIKPAFDNIGKWFTEHQDQITNFFLHLPDIGRIALNTLFDMIKRLFTWEAYSQMLIATGQFYIEFWKAILLTLWEIVKAVGKTIWEPLKVGFEWAAYGIKTAWRAMVEFLVDLFNKIIAPIETAINAIPKLINKAIEAAPRISEKLGLQEVGEVSLGLAAPDWGGPLEKPGAVDRNAMKNAWKDFGANLKQIGADLWAQVKDTAAGIAAPFEDVGEGFVDDIREVLNRDLPEGMRSAATVLEDSVEEGGKKAADHLSILETLRAGGGGGTGGAGGGGGPGGGGPLTGLLSQLAPVINSAIGGLGSLSGVLQPLIGSVLGLTASFNPIMLIVTAVGWALEGLMEVLGPLIEDVLTPLAGIFRIIGKIVGQMWAPVFEVLGPIIEAVGKVFVWLYNKVIRPVGNAMISIFNIAFNAVAAVANGFIWIYNLLRRKSKHLDYIEYRGLKEGHMGELTYEDVEQAGKATLGTTDTERYGAGASYTSGRTMNIQININTDVLTGEGGFRQLAIMLRDEIRSLEALGA